MKSRLMDHIRLIFLFTVIYVILSENMNGLTVGLGVIAGSVAIILTNKILEIDYVKMFQINSRLILTYFWVILRDTYVMGFDTIIRIFKGNIKPNFIHYRSDLNDELLTVLLANAITMPPGTITVDRKGNEMTVLTVGFEKDEFCKTTYHTIEKLLKRFDIEKKR